MTSTPAAGAGHGSHGESRPSEAAPADAGAGAGLDASDESEGETTGAQPVDIPADREECEEEREHEPPRALPVLPATLQTILRIVDRRYRAEAQAQLQAGGQFDFKSLGFVLAVRNVVR